MKRVVSTLLFALLLLCQSALVKAQGDIPVLTWRSHFSYRSIIDITQSSSRIYAAAPNGLFYVDKQELSVSKLTKNDGLSDVSIGAIGYAQSQNTLIIGYANGNIDLVQEGSVTNIPTFLEAQLIGSKRFHDVNVANSLVYLSSDQGILVIDLAQKEIIESYQNLGIEGSKLPVYSTTILGDSIYAATARGMLSASLTSSLNRQDFNNWNRTLRQLSFVGVASNGNLMSAITSDRLYAYQADQWALTSTFTEPLVDVAVGTSTTLALSTDKLYGINDSGVTTLLDLPESESTAAAILTNGADVWLGDELNGLRRFVNGSSDAFSPTGPASDFNWTFSGTTDDILLLHGGYSDQLNSLGRKGEISSFSRENGWSSSSLSLGINNDFFDLVDIEPSSAEGAPLYLASFDRGLLSLTNDELTPINESMPASTLTPINGSFNMTAIASEGNGLWMTNYAATRSLHFWDTTTNEWAAYNLSTARGDFPIGLFVAPNGDKWLPIDPERGGGIVVFNESRNAERYLGTNGGQGGLPGAHVTSIALDDDFFVWVGTNEGIGFYPNLNSVLDGTALTASTPIFEGRTLLRDEFITSVVIDPGNRKWFGTRDNGVWLFSETGEALIYHFTADNSPLPSDHVQHLFIQKETGELFIGTDQGTVSFRSDATQGTDTHQEVTIYPNPAMRNAVEQIVINGLVNNAQIKITDASGKLVREIRAQGSTALWNARDYNGRTVSAGVYLVFSSNDDGSETFVGKIAVI